MATQVVSSRIQNRRGTRSQFDALYPEGYRGVGKFGTSTTPPAAFTNVVGDGTTLVITIPSANLVAPYDTLLVVGSTIVIKTTPAAVYDGSYTVGAINRTPVDEDGNIIVGTTLISCASNYTGPMIGPGSIYMPYDAANYPNILQPGELALCMDTYELFIGNEGGEYIKLAVSGAAGLRLVPLIRVLPSSSTPVPVPNFFYPPTNFFSFLYDLTDSPVIDEPGKVGPTFARNGEIRITAVGSPMVPTPPALPPPLLPITSVNLVDTSTEINLTPQYDISFTAQYDVVNSPSSIEIFYQHNFPTSLVLSIGAVGWAND